ncbi:hypothetical protein [Lentzea albida]|uniref:MFS transporter, CP family, cyanate transporter n=1 Tax=Lentzea albida TaxID=65499 RepID=A0A1H9XF09_9PSEU|nr:hypothetical protein [Lentzea albida]SES44621.1 MFS transporter, CP family, cyanate transporter [Lentzea albida]
MLWLPRAWTGRPAVESTSDENRPSASVWRQPAAWLVTAFMGLQSTTFYVMVTWLPTVEMSSGVPAAQAGVHLFVYQIVGVAMVVGAAGLLLLPSWSIVWAVVAGLGTGASLVVALTLISLRGRGRQGTTQLSGMAQSLGYLLAALGPVLAGLLAEHTGSWTASLLLVGVLAVVQVVVAAAAGRVSPRPEAVRGKFPAGR